MKNVLTSFVLHWAGSTAVIALRIQTVCTKIACELPVSYVYKSVMYTKC